MALFTPFSAFDGLALDHFSVLLQFLSIHDLVIFTTCTSASLHLLKFGHKRDANANLIKNSFLQPYFTLLNPTLIKLHPRHFNNYYRAILAQQQIIPLLGLFRYDVGKIVTPAYFHKQSDFGSNSANTNQREKGGILSVTFEISGDGGFLNFDLLRQEFPKPHPRNIDFVTHHILTLPFFINGLDKELDFSDAVVFNNSVPEFMVSLCSNKKKSKWLAQSELVNTRNSNALVYGVRTTREEDAVKRKMVLIADEVAATEGKMFVLYQGSYVENVSFLMGDGASFNTFVDDETILLKNPILKIKVVRDRETCQPPPPVEDEKKGGADAEREGEVKRKKSSLRGLLSFTFGEKSEILSERFCSKICPCLALPIFGDIILDDVTTLDDVEFVEFPNLFKKNFGPHGAEIIDLEYDRANNTLFGRKVTGDNNVPANKLSFRVDDFTLTRLPNSHDQPHACTTCQGGCACRLFSDQVEEHNLLIGGEWVGERAKRASLLEDENIRDGVREMAADGYIWLHLLLS